MGIKNNRPLSSFLQLAQLDLYSDQQMADRLQISEKKYRKIIKSKKVSLPSEFWKQLSRLYEGEFQQHLGVSTKRFRTFHSNAQWESVKEETASRSMAHTS